MSNHIFIFSGVSFLPAVNAALAHLTNLVEVDGKRVTQATKNDAALKQHKPADLIPPPNNLPLAR